MKTNLVIVAKTATLAMNEQARLIMEDKPLAAARWVEKLWDKIASLETFPQRNPVSEQESRTLGFEVRKLIFGTYLLFISSMKKRCVSMLFASATLHDFRKAQQNPKIIPTMNDCYRKFRNTS